VVEITTITAEETRPLRHRVLRPTQPAEAAEYPGDHDPDTCHFGAFDGGRLVGIASLYREARVDGQTDGWRLRGMATAVDSRGRGAGRALLGACCGHIAARGGGELWCNARMAAHDFYTAAGLEPTGPQFHIEDIGAHVVMRTDIPAGT